MDLLTPNPNGTGSYRLKPDIDLVTRIGRREVRIRTNRHGMHWSEVTIRKNDGRRRIAFLGDSFTFGAWADGYEESFVGTFDKNVSSERWEVLNFGVGGYGLADEELLLREQVLEFSPSYVIVVVFAGNDFRDTYLGIDKESIIDGAAELQDAKVRAVVPAELLVDDATVSAPCALAPGPRRWLEALSSFCLMSPWFGLENLVCRVLRESEFHHVHVLVPIPSRATLPESSFEMTPTDAIIAVTMNCNSRCVMCDIWKNEIEGEMAPGEERNILCRKMPKSSGRSAPSETRRCRGSSISGSPRGTWPPSIGGSGSSLGSRS